MRRDHIQRGERCGTLIFVALGPRIDPGERDMDEWKEEEETKSDNEPLADLPQGGAGEGSV